MKSQNGVSQTPCTQESPGNLAYYSLRLPLQQASVCKEGPHASGGAVWTPKEASPKALSFSVAKILVRVLEDSDQ